ncbi:hypothetical protein [Chryseobacterium turcicum]|uniref:Uncharacterized protein n=1 Tax=Chryseobacterium turcicum TaxID=2898076 RepID=A0A9Q3V5W5_9FLAO|nr:hypothetical protein [Chryseobacterium turcicum]MCD1117906.1 hypothetical protein [Chryseobacterium turcicum]
MEENYLKFKILVFVRDMIQTYNIIQFEGELDNAIENYKNYKKYFEKAVNGLKDEGLIYTSKNNTGTTIITGISDKGKNILRFNNWNEYEDSLNLEKQKEKDLKALDYKLKEITLKNQKLTPYISILGLVFGLGSMIWSIMDKYKLIFIDISIYFLLLILFAILGILIFKKINLK